MNRKNRFLAFSRSFEDFVHRNEVLPNAKGDNFEVLEGIDLIARTREQEYWAIQAKFVGKHDQPPTRRNLGTFLSCAFHTCAGKFLPWQSSPIPRQSRFESGT